VLRRLPLRFSFVFAWSLVGLFGAWHTLRGGGARTAAALASLMVLLVGVYFGSFLPYIAAEQYRAPILPLLMAFAGVGLWGVLQPLLEGQIRVASLWLVAGLALWGLLSINYTGYRPNEAHWHLMRGVSEERAGDLGMAEASYRAAVQARPGLDVAHRRLGVTLAQQERYDEAIEAFERVLELSPDNLDARHSLGLALALLGRVEAAIPHFEAVVRGRPDYREARHNLQQAYWVTGRTPAADQGP
jgi:tetratricopeptide (TPR) repeat protein